MINNYTLFSGSGLKGVPGAPGLPSFGIKGRAGPSGPPGMPGSKVTLIQTGSHEQHDTTSCFAVALFFILYWFPAFTLVSVVTGGQRGRFSRSAGSVRPPGRRWLSGGPRRPRTPRTRWSSRTTRTRWTTRTQR